MIGAVVTVFGVVGTMASALGPGAGAGGDAPGSGPPPVEVDFTLGSVLVALFWACVFAVPLAISVWALLDAARRPRWAWALSGRRQVVWMAVIMGGILSVIGGLLVSGYYLVRVRPQVAAVEDGRIGKP